MDKGYKYLQQQFDLNTESSRVTEKVLNNKVKKVLKKNASNNPYSTVTDFAKFLG